MSLSCRSEGCLCQTSTIVRSKTVKFNNTECVQRTRECDECKHQWKTIESDLVITTKCHIYHK